jgi:hypothetical protein
LAGKILSSEIVEKSERILLTGNGGYEHLACPSGIVGYFALDCCSHFPDVKNQPSLSEEEVVRIASFVMQLENHYGRPQGSCSFHLLSSHLMARHGICSG